MSGAVPRTVPGSTAMQERRRSPRVPYICEVECVEVHSGTRPSRARLSDVSLQGAFVDSIVTFDVGAVVQLHFVLPSLQMAVEAEVVNVMPNMGMGVRFRTVTPAQRAALEELLEAGVL